MDEESFAWLQRAALKDVVPHRHEGFGNGRGFHHGEAFRQGKRHRLVGGAILRIAAADDERSYFVADLPALYLVADRGDFARDLEAGNVGGAGRRRI